MTYLKRLLPYLSKYRAKLFLGFIVILLGAVFSNVIPLVLASAIDSMKIKVDYSILFTRALTTVGLAVLGAVFLYFTRQTIIIVSREIEIDLRSVFISIWAPSASTR